MKYCWFNPDILKLSASEWLGFEQFQSIHAKAGSEAVLTVLCAEITCGPPLSVPHTRMRWDGSSTAADPLLLYECMGGFYHQSGTNSSTCSQLGQWANVSVECKSTLFAPTHLHPPVPAQPWGRGQHTATIPSLY